MTDTPLRRLQQLLSELFQLEHVGIYRLFRIKRDEVKAFVEDQLPRSVDAAFGAAAADERAAAAEELAKVAQALGVEFGRHLRSGRIAA
jgi:adenine-specific DNA-methyltransferase